ncbi:hypothetical protein MLAC_06950 [Mycobacterium lacus]|uniref:Uncharacterized protein n=1 Tax=Mycobacterium lacus TaxID=169765 RepID=A0A7I7NIA7_9MYCO|nr:hypothetical protein MLAC_06950 [Mycobacterium lacus]
MTPKALSVNEFQYFIMSQSGKGAELAEEFEDFDPSLDRPQGQLLDDEPMAADLGSPK